MKISKPRTINALFNKQIGCFVEIGIGGNRFQLNLSIYLHFSSHQLWPFFFTILTWNLFCAVFGFSPRSVNCHFKTSQLFHQRNQQVTFESVGWLTHNWNSSNKWHAYGVGRVCSGWRRYTIVWFVWTLMRQVFHFHVIGAIPANMFRTLAKICIRSNFFFLSNRKLCLTVFKCMRVNLKRVNISWHRIIFISCCLNNYICAQTITDSLCRCVRYNLSGKKNVIVSRHSQSH